MNFLGAVTSSAWANKSIPCLTMALDCEGAGVGAVMLVSIFVLRQGVQVTTLSSSGRAAELEFFPTFVPLGDLPNDR